MDWSLTLDFLGEIERVLAPRGHMMWWVDKFSLCESRTPISGFPTVDLITWEKSRIGMGYRTRRKAEYLLINQKLPKRAKGVWTDHAIPDVWTHQMEIEEMKRRKPEIITGHSLAQLRLSLFSGLVKKHPHAKPLGLQSRLIEAVTRKNDIVCDFTAGGYSVLEACRLTGRNFLGCDVRRWR